MPSRVVSAGFSGVGDGVGGSVGRCIGVTCVYNVFARVAGPNGHGVRFGFAGLDRAVVCRRRRVWRHDHRSVTGRGLGGGVGGRFDDWRVGSGEQRRRGRAEKLGAHAGDAVLVLQAGAADRAALLCTRARERKPYQRRGDQRDDPGDGARAPVRITHHTSKVSPSGDTVFYSGAPSGLASASASGLATASRLALALAFALASALPPLASALPSSSAPEA